MTVDATDGAPPPPSPREAVADALMWMANGDLANADDFIAALSRRGFRVAQEEAPPAINDAVISAAEGAYRLATRCEVCDVPLSDLCCYRHFPLDRRALRFALVAASLVWQPIVKPEGPTASPEGLGGA